MLKEWFKKKKYFPFCIKNTDKILILAPHPDDEVLGCGGFLLKYPQQCTVVYLTNGCLGDATLSREENIAIRKAELDKVMNTVGIKNYQYLNIPDKQMRRNLKQLRQLKLRQYDYVFVPNKYETHKDHKCLYRRVKLLTLLAKTKVAMYEVWVTLPHVSHYLNISDCIEQKRELIGLYQSQLKSTDYFKIIALNQYRGMWPKVSFAEAFWIK
ncbi:MAG: PIG-L family deacetylase [Deltaproteobacteria bacterium]|jgi:LmbE family N-acetylglucosaminyl deacetylase|nr:PIG-L family deacetylase [Deltaproteobacteria bacterium]